jgi:hypothetical protein
MFIKVLQNLIAREFLITNNLIDEGGRVNKRERKSQIKIYSNVKRKFQFTLQSKN